MLWAIQDLDRKWLLLQKRKSALNAYYNKRFEEESRRIYDETRLNLNQQLFESILKSLKTAESEREVDDVDAKFNLHFPPGEVVVDEGQYKRPMRRSQYSVCSKAGLWEVASKFGYSAEQLGMQLSLLKMVSLPRLVITDVFYGCITLSFHLILGGRVAGCQGNTRGDGFKFYMCNV